ncbi:N-acetyltransferase [Pseudonocardiaceae bacterium YIM PH 21723]|nr:N-acetyltransferase [Pseudonocardiaceae bacterium YIM PH 21723]
MIDIRLLPAGTDSSVIAGLVALTNAAYRVAEKGLWVEGTDRTDTADMTKLVQAGEIVAACDAGGRIRGSMRLFRLDSGEADFGMLAVDPEARGAGVGRALIGFAERWAVDNSLDVLQLELLWPREWTHPEKAFLREWYTRIGFELTRVDDFSADYPSLSTRLATPCDLLIFHKSVR